LNGSLIHSYNDSFHFLFGWLTNYPLPNNCQYYVKTKSTHSSCFTPHLFQAFAFAPLVNIRHFLI